MSIYRNETILALFTPLFDDGKQFIDSCLLISVDDFYAKVAKAQTKEQLLQIYTENFKPPSEVYIPSHPHLQNADTAIDGQFGHWSRSLFQIYGTLLKHPQRHSDCVEDSLIQTEFPYIVPGGRFQESYYWDSYWLIKGVLDQEVRHGIFKNFCGFVRKFGFVPNGNRQYYLNRSQPPMLVLMVEDELARLPDEEKGRFMESMLPCLDIEYDWWMAERSVNLYGGQLNQQRVITRSPRPESYRQDLQQFLRLKNNRTAQDLYSSLATAAESGWDFSSRWFNTQKYGDGFDSIDPMSLIPVDLNAIMYRNEVLLSQYHSNCTAEPCSLKQEGKAHFYKMAANQRKLLISKYLWNNQASAWMDYDTAYEDFRQWPSQYYLSTLFPLWAGAYDAEDIEQLLVSLEQAGFFSYIAGVPTSLYNSQQQWDSPNAWPPLQWMLTEALMKLPQPLFKKYSKTWVPRLAQQWIDTNYCGWYEANRNGTVLTGMYEKYDVTQVGKPGHAGEYQVQTGFGWTNGVVLDYLRRFSRYNSSGMPEWFKSDGSLEKLGWPDGLQVPNPQLCGSQMGIKSTSTQQQAGFALMFVVIVAMLISIGIVVVRKLRSLSSYKQVEQSPSFQLSQWT